MSLKIESVFFNNRTLRFPDGAFLQDVRVAGLRKILGTAVIQVLKTYWNRKLFNGVKEVECN